MSPNHLNRLRLAGEDVDRDYLARSRPELFDELAADPDARVLALWRGRTLMTDAAATHLALIPISTLDTAQAAVRIYLGRTLAGARSRPGIRVVAAVLTDDAASRIEPDEQRWEDLRTAGPRLDSRDAALFTEALAMANWHDSHRFSPRSGERMRVAEGGWVRRSATDNSDVFPRTDPAVIVRILDDDDRILLGSNALWAGNRYSLLAGFVEPGESLEAIGRAHV